MHVGSGADSFTWDAHARPLTNFHGDTGAGPGGLWTATPAYDWTQNPLGTAVAYVTSPLSGKTTVIGAGAVEAWVRSSTPNVDLQATVTEVRPDGKETYVQSGWVRADERKLDPDKSTPLEPVLSLRESDVSPMPPDQFVPVTIPLYYEGHAYRAGSRILVTISAPNGDQPIWSFSETEPNGTATVDIARSSDKALPGIARAVDETPRSGSSATLLVCVRSPFETRGRTGRSCRTRPRARRPVRWCEPRGRRGR